LATAVPVRGFHRAGPGNYREIASPIFTPLTSNPRILREKLAVGVFKWLAYSLTDRYGLDFPADIHIHLACISNQTIIV
jgi:hypothetical protein